VGMSDNLSLRSGKKWKRVEAINIPTKIIGHKRG